MLTDTDEVRGRVGRRGFLGYAAGLTAAMGATACASPMGGDPKKGELRDRRFGKADNLMFDGDFCLSGPTGTDVLGPYWTPNIQETIQLAAPQEDGQRMLISGHVFAGDCATILSGATVVAWQADDDGLYDYNHAGLNQGGTERQLGQDETNLRGLFETSVSGTYSFETIFPRQYPMNLLDPDNSAYRTPHIHFAVFYRDRRGVQHQLVTQMYFRANDLIQSRIPDIVRLNAEDGSASGAESSRFVDVLGGGRDLWTGTFNIVLDVDPGDVA